MDAHDEARRLLERDIHDGAQQHLVALAVNLRLVRTLSESSSAELVPLLEDQRRAAVEALSTLVRLSQGIYPALLTEGGLTGALTCAAETSVIPVHISATTVGRYANEVEAAAYFCALEALQNAGKHSGAAGVRLVLVGGPDHLSVLVEDDGAGFDGAGEGEGDGLMNMRDRVESVGGELSVRSAIGAGTRIGLRLPATPRVQAPHPLGPA